jgi:hypothetical protein
MLIMKVLRIVLSIDTPAYRSKSTNSSSFTTYIGFNVNAVCALHVQPITFPETLSPAMHPRTEQHGRATQNSANTAAYHH